MPLSIDAIPKNNFEKVIHKLDKTYEWDKVVELNMADINEQNFIPLLHNIDKDKIETLLAKM